MEPDTRLACSREPIHIIVLWSYFDAFSWSTYTLTEREDVRKMFPYLASADAFFEFMLFNEHNGCHEERNSSCSSSKSVLA
jgi:hypothetical protein